MADENAPMEIDTPWRRDAAEVGASLEKWAQSEIAPDATLVSVSAPDNGMSSESVLFDIEHGGTVDRLVARLAPLPSLVPVFQNYDIEMQAKAMRLVGERTDVPVPEVPYLVLDEGVLESQFLVMRRVEGRAPADIPPYPFMGWVFDMTDDERATMQRNAVSVLVRLHELRPDNADLSFLERPDEGDSHLDQHLGHERNYYEWARDGVTYPLIEATFEWLEANRPTLTNPSVLNWGDARIGNMLWDGTEPSAVLDWEMASVGPAEVDLAWMIFLHTFFQDMAETLRLPRPARLHAARRHGCALHRDERPARRGPRVVRGVRRPALRHRVGAHRHPRCGLRPVRGARRPRRPHHVPQAAPADGRRHVLGLTGLAAAVGGTFAQVSGCDVSSVTSSPSALVASPPMSRLDDLRRVEEAITRIGRISTGREAARIRAERAGLSLSRPAISILSALRKSGPVRLSSLARLTDLEAPLISREIRELVDAGYVDRVADPTDGRAGIVALTSDGVEAYQAYREATDEIIAETFANWGGGDLRALRVHLERLADDFARPPALNGRRTARTG